MKLRLASYYAASIGSLSFVPFLSPLIAAQTGDDRIVAATLAVLPAGRLLGGTSWAWLADRMGTRPVLRLTTLAAALLGVVVLLAPSPTILAGALLLFAFMRAPQFPIVDALALRELGAGYGQVRAWGSVVFLCLVLLAGQMRSLHAAAPVAVAVLLLSAAAVLAYGMPAPATPLRRVRISEVGTLLRDPTLRLVLLISLFQGMTLTSYDTLFSLHVERLAMGDMVASLAIALGVGGEIVLMAASRPLLDRVGPRRLLLLAALSGLPRWAVTATASDPQLLIAAQALHALGFGAFWIAGTRLVADLAPEGLASTAQSLFPAAGWGVGYLVSMGLAAVLLPLGTHHVFTASLAVSALASVLALRLVRTASSK